MRIALIAAMDENRLIGNDGELPWHYPKDLAHFKETTTGHPVLMGRITYDDIVGALGTPLPDRWNIVLTSSEGAVSDHESVCVASSLDEALDTAETILSSEFLTPTETDTLYVIGGASVYDQCIDIADQLVITEIHDSHEGDAYFPNWDDSEWVEKTRDPHEDLSFVTYERDQ